VAGGLPWRGPLGRLLLGWAACLGLVLLAVPVGHRAGAGTTGVRFLAELLSDGAWRWLSASTRPPVREPPIDTPGLAAHVWRPAGGAPWPALVLVHGLTPAGRDDARLGWAAELLARAGFRVVVPDLPALRRQQLRPEDAGAVAAALGVVEPPASIVAVSVGARPAIAAAADPALAARVRLVVSLGGYAEARELVRYFTTGAYGLGGVAGRVRLDPALGRAFLGLNLDLVRDAADRAAVAAALEGGPLPATAGAEARAVLAVLENRDPARVDALLAALPSETRALLDALSPARLVGRLPSRLVLVHGRDDPAIPFTESLRLAAAADPRRTRLVLVDLFVHVEGRPPGWRQVRDLLGLWSVVFELLRVSPHVPLPLWGRERNAPRS
jgi:pimeloyl-ACP methyl ester carboxylesterase